jgi:hypothetical protein
MNERQDTHTHRGQRGEVVTSAHFREREKKRREGREGRE